VHTLARSSFVVLAAALAAAVVSAQPPSRIATTPEALVAAPVFFHGKQVVVRQGTVEQAGVTVLANTTKPIAVFWRERGTGGLDSEIRGEFWDLGRLQRDDPRFSTIDFTALLQAEAHGQWPSRDQLFVILNATTVESPLPADPSVRALALAPGHYAGKQVTVVGRFRGANLFGDLPLPVAKSRWDFVLQSADAAVWVTGIRPRGKGFDLDPGARRDTGGWLQVSGTVRADGPLPWIEATSVAEASAPTETTIEVPLPATPPQPPPAVIFSAPIEQETDVDRGTTVRIQFSRDMDGASFRNAVRASYVGPQPGDTPKLTVRYDEGNRALTIRFDGPLEPNRQVRVQLLDGITSAIDKQPLAPWALTFTTGG
jgi:hypothetical protein